MRRMVGTLARSRMEFLTALVLKHGPMARSTKVCGAREGCMAMESWCWKRTRALRESSGMDSLGAWEYENGRMETTMKVSIVRATSRDLASLSAKNKDGSMMDNGQEAR